MRMTGDAILDRPVLFRRRGTAAGRLASRTARVIDLVKPRAKTLPDIVPKLVPFLRDDVERDAAAVTKHLSAPDLHPHLEAWREQLETVQPFDPATLETALRAVAESRGIKAGTLIHATRVAVTGQAVSRDFEVLALVGRERVLRVIRWLKWRSPVH